MQGIPVCQLSHTAFNNQHQINVILIFLHLSFTVTLEIIVSNLILLQLYMATHS